MGDSWDEWFIEKIKEGLSLSSDSLTQEEENLLRTKAVDLSEDPNFSPEFAQKLQAKCTGALSEIYARDTAKNKQAAIEWRENNKYLYENSDIALSGIVQNWYLSVGRAQEKQVVKPGCLSSFILVWILILTILLLVFV